jgi:hypothetical protein
MSPQQPSRSSRCHLKCKGTPQNTFTTAIRAVFLMLRISRPASAGVRLRWATMIGLSIVLVSTTPSLATPKPKTKNPASAACSTKKAAQLPVPGAAPPADVILRVQLLVSDLRQFCFPQLRAANLRISDRFDQFGRQFILDIEVTLPNERSLAIGMVYGTDSRTSLGTLGYLDFRPHTFGSERIVQFGSTPHETEYIAPDETRLTNSGEIISDGKYFAPIAGTKIEVHKLIIETLRSFDQAIRSGTAVAYFESLYSKAFSPDPRTVFGIPYDAINTDTQAGPGTCTPSDHTTAYSTVGEPFTQWALKYGGTPHCLQISMRLERNPLSQASTQEIDGQPGQHYTHQPSASIRFGQIDLLKQDTHTSLRSFSKDECSNRQMIITDNILTRYTDRALITLPPAKLDALLQAVFTAEKDSACVPSNLTQ